MEQAALDRRIQQFYSRFAEAERLTTMSAAGRLELERIQELLRARLKPGSHIIDVGGATGVHATWLAAEGHDVVLVDPIASQVEIAAQAGIFTAVVGDARCLDFAAGSFDAALLFGPLYHLHSRDDRLRALGEAKRVVCPGGLVFAVGISRCSAIVAGMLATIPETADERVIGLINDGAWDASGGFPLAHAHTTAELELELAAAGLAEVESVCVEGPLGQALEYTQPGDEELFRAAKLAAQRMGAEPGIKESGPHLLAWGCVPPSRL